MIKSLDGYKDDDKNLGGNVELKQCIALGDSFSRHTVTNIKN
jgi:hypothetical protein